MQPSSGFPRITRELARDRWYLTFQQFYTFPENVKTIPPMTFDLQPDVQCHVKRNLRAVPFQSLKLANFGIGDMDKDRCGEVTSMIHTNNATFPRSTEVIRGI